jgi:ADP-ribosylation factor 1/2
MVTCDALARLRAAELAARRPFPSPPHRGALVSLAGWSPPTSHSTSLCPASPPPPPPPPPAHPSGFNVETVE